MKFFENGNTQVFALGGLGEVGKNMYVVMHNNEIIIILINFNFSTLSSHIINF